MLVVNYKRYGSKRALDRAFGGRWVYIGRANRSAGFEASPLANPFRVTVSRPRSLAIESYRTWLMKRLYAKDGAVTAALRALTPESVLVCWCAPEPCHAEAVFEAAAWLRTADRLNDRLSS